MKICSKAPTFMTIHPLTSPSISAIWAAHTYQKKSWVARGYSPNKNENVSRCKLHFSKILTWNELWLLFQPIFKIELIWHLTLVCDLWPHESIKSSMLHLCSKLGWNPAKHVQDMAKYYWQQTAKERAISMCLSSLGQATQTGKSWIFGELWGTKTSCIIIFRLYLIITYIISKGKRWELGSMCLTLKLDKIVIVKLFTRANNST